MFTGLVVERGRVAVRRDREGTSGVWLEVHLSSSLAEGLSLGASLSVEGCCLTVVDNKPVMSDGPSEASGAQASSPTAGGAVVALELSPETLERTTLGSLEVGDAVNLEPALQMGQPLGGHWVQGHIDCTTELIERDDADDFSTFWWSLPSGLESSFVQKGSVTMDGVSLTVAELRADRFSVALIPHTLEVTTLGLKRPGSLSNVEVDVLAKYVDRVVAARMEALEQRLSSTAPSR